MAKIYVVTMYRWADREKHSYVLGVFSTRLKAFKAGDKERIYRGCTKYFPEVLEYSINDMASRKVILSLENSSADCFGKGSND